MKSILITFLLFPFLATVACAQAPRGDASGVEERIQAISLLELEARETLATLRGTEIVDREDLPMATITDFEVHEDGRIAFAYARWDDGNRFARRWVHIPFDALEARSGTDRRLHLDVSKEDWAAALQEVGDTFDLPGGAQVRVVSAEQRADRETLANVWGARVAASGGEQVGTLTDFIVEDGRIIAAAVELGADFSPAENARDGQEAALAQLGLGDGAEAYGAPSGHTGETSTAASGTAGSRDRSTPGTAIIGGSERSPGEGSITDMTGPATQPGAIARDHTTDPRQMSEDAQPDVPGAVQPESESTFVEIPFELLERTENEGVPRYRVPITLASFRDRFPD